MQEHCWQEDRSCFSVSGRAGGKVRTGQIAFFTYAEDMFDSLYENLCRYQKATPQRFRSQPLGGCYGDASAQVKNYKCKIIMGQKRETLKKKIIT